MTCWGCVAFGLGTLLVIAVRVPPRVRGTLAVYPIPKGDAVPEVRLPDRLRYLAGRFTMPEHAVDVREALRGAADELERLEREAYPEHLGAQPRQTFLATTIAGGGARFAAPPGHLFAAIALPEAEARRLAGDRDPMPGLGVELDALGRELAGQGGVPEPSSRRFAARYADPSSGTPYATPAPGSFVFCGPALAVWRVLGVEPLEGDTRGTHALELEPVDAHDVPMLSRVDTVPLPVSELAPEDLGETSGTSDGRGLFLCAAGFTPPSGGAMVPCVRVHGHPGEHLWRWEDDDGPREVAHDAEWDGPPRVVDADSPAALEALEREGGRP